MSHRRKKVVFAVLAIVVIYALAPLFAGIIGTYDRRGPKIFAVGHHEILYRIGNAMAGRGGKKIPFMRERAWFYGIEGERMPERQR